MPTQHLIASCLLGLTLTLVAVFPQSPVVGVSFTAAVVLFGFLQFLDRTKTDRIEAFEAQLKRLEDRIQILMIGRGGR